MIAAHWPGPITLTESQRPDHRAIGAEVLSLVMPPYRRAQRLGITGVPGAGKSTFIESFGHHAETATLLKRQGHRVKAVLAIDPTSSRTGGSITR